MLGGKQERVMAELAGQTRVTIFTHSGAPQALVGCLGRLGSPPTPQELRAEQDTADG
jgi:hypothetical protein